MDNKKPSTVFYLNNKPDNIVRLETTSNSTSSCSKQFNRINRSKSQSRIPMRKKVVPPPTTTKRGLTSLSLPRPRKKTATVAPMKPPVPRTIKSQCSKVARKPPLPTVKLVKSKTSHTLKTYPDSFTVLPSPKRSPSAGCLTKRRRSSDFEDDDSIQIETGWMKPSAEKLLEFASPHDDERLSMDCEIELMGEEEEDNEELKNRKYNIDQFGQKVSMPTTPIITDRVKTGSKNR